MSKHFSNGYTYIWIPLLLIGLQSCFVGKVYQRPEVATDSLYRMDTTLSADSTSMADLPWEELFTDTVLQGYIHRAISNNLDIRTAIENIRVAEAYLKQGKAGNLPTLNAQGNYTLLKPSEYGQYAGLDKDVLNQFDLTATLSWEADIWGRIRSQKRALQDQYLQSVAAQKAVQTRLVASVASLYYQLLSLDKQAQIATTSIADRKNSLRVNKALKEGGKVTAVAIKQAEAQVYSAQLILVDLKKNIQLLESAFSLLLGDPPHAIARTELDQQAIPVPLETGVPSLLLENRPDIMAAEYSLMNAFELTNVAKAQFYPSLTLTASAGLQSTELDHWFSTSALFSSVAAGLFQPILNGRKIRTQYEVALSQKEIALLDYKQALLGAGQEVSDAMKNYQSATTSIAIQKKQVAALQLATEYSQKLLNNGLANYLEVLTARQQALSAQLQLVDSHYQQLHAIVTLYQALGGGWQ